LYQPKRDFAKDGALKDLVLGVLERDANLAATGARGFGALMGRDAVEQDLARGGFEQTGEKLHQRRFPRTGRADDSDLLPGRNL
jgi:hypothetical protein